MSEPAYIVRKGGLVLEVVGPFGYPNWSSTAATPLSWTRAHAFAAAFGGDVVPVHAVPYANTMLPPRVPRETETPPPEPFPRTRMA